MMVHVANNAELGAYPYKGVVHRDGFATAGDGGAATYTYSATTCLIPGGDGGSQVPATPSGCWLLDPGTPRFAIQIWGGKADSNCTPGSGIENAGPIKAAIAYVQKTGGTLFFPGTIGPTGINSNAGATCYRVGSTIPNISSNITIQGEGGEVPVSMLYLDHAGRGFDITLTTDPGSIVFEKIGFYRNQPAPSATNGVAWTPNNNDWDIAKAGHGDLRLRDVMMENATNGLYASNGRIVIDGLRGQFMNNGMYFENIYDTVSIANFRSWPYWQQNENVFTYTLTNTKAIFLGQLDNPNFTNIFAIYNAYTFYFYNGNPPIGAAPTSRAKLANVDIDGFGTHGIFIDNPFTTIQGTNIAVQGSGRTAGYGDSGIYVSANAHDSVISLANYRSTNTAGPALNIQAPNVLAQIAGFHVDGYGFGSSAVPAINCARGSYVDLMDSVAARSVSNIFAGNGSASNAANYLGGTAYTLTAGDMLALPDGTGTVTMNDKVSGSFGGYALGNGAVTPMFNSSGSLFQNVGGGPTAIVKSNTPPGKIGVGFATDTVAASGGYPAMQGSTYRLYNNTSSTVTVTYRFQGYHPNP